jgi:hypothetical protein
MPETHISLTIEHAGTWAELETRLREALNGAGIVHHSTGVTNESEQAALRRVFTARRIRYLETL